MNGKKSMTGFTLIEILVTLTIVSVAVLSLGKFTISMMNSGQVSRERLTGVHLAEQILEFWQQDTNDFSPAIATNCNLSAATTAPTYPVIATCTPALISTPSGTNIALGVRIPFTIKLKQTQARGPLPLPASQPVFNDFTKQGMTNMPQIKVVTITWSRQGKTHSVYLTHISEVR